MAGNTVSKGNESMEIDFERMPNFLIIGFPKCGTTTLYDVARQHPGIFVSEKKELNFYGRQYERGAEWYLNTHFSAAGGYAVRGEASPSYLTNAPITAERIRDAYQDRPLKFVAIFREPAERAYSQYWHWVRDGVEDLPFEEALEAERALFAANPDRLPPVIGREWRRYFYNGRYATLLKPFLARFPRERFLFLLTEDLKRDFGGASKRMYEFLGADANFEPEPVAKNISKTPRSQLLHKNLHAPASPLRRTARALLQIFPTAWRERWKVDLQNANLKAEANPAMNPETRRTLIEQYRDEVKELEGLIGRDLSQWYRGEPG